MVNSGLATDYREDEGYTIGRNIYDTKSGNIVCGIKNILEEILGIKSDDLCKEMYDNVKTNMNSNEDLKEDK